MATRVLITGGGGMLATYVGTLLHEKGYEVVFLSRSHKKSEFFKTYTWDLALGTLDEGCLEGTDYILHLAGASIAEKRWTESRKKEIIRSRTESIRLVYQAIKNNPQHQIKACVSAGAIGYYGSRGNEWVDEQSPKGKGFLSESCAQWEKAVMEGEALGLRVAFLRIGMVLTRDGGGLKPLERLTALALGAPLGAGNQWISWIHIHDVCRILIRALEDSTFRGAYNAVAPHPVTNEEFTQELALAMHKPLFLPHVPLFLLRTILGEMAEVVTDSTRVSEKKLAATGFEFQYKTLKKAFQGLYSELDMK